MNKIDYLQFAKAAQVAASECIANCRRQHQSGHYTQRGVMVLAIDAEGERIGDPIEYLEVKEISGKRLRSIVNTRAPGQWDSITVQGGIDEYDSFTDAMQYPDEYNPQVEGWDVNSNDLEAAQVTRPERIPEAPRRLILGNNPR